MSSRGIGPWTADGALLIAFGWPDVLVSGDLVLRKAAQRAYELPELPSEKEVEAIGAHRVSPTAAVYCGTKYAVWAISNGLQQETDTLRVTVISPGVVTSELAETITDEATRGVMAEYRKVAIGPDAIGRAVLYAIEQPEDVDVREIIVGPTGSSN